MRAAAPHTHLWGGGAGEAPSAQGAAVNDDVENSVHGGFTVGFEGVGSSGVFVFLQGFTMSFVSPLSPLPIHVPHVRSPLHSLPLPPIHVSPVWLPLPSLPRSSLLAPPTPLPPTVSRSKNW